MASMKDTENTIHFNYPTDGKPHRRIDDSVTPYNVFLCCLSGHVISLRNNAGVSKTIVQEDDLGYENYLVLTTCIKCNNNTKYTPISIHLINGGTIHTACRNICKDDVKILSDNGYVRYLDIQSIMSTMTNYCQLSNVEYDTPHASGFNAVLGYLTPGFLF